MAMLKEGKCVDLVRLLKAITVFVQSMLPNLEHKIVRMKEGGAFYKSLAFPNDDREYDVLLGSPFTAIIFFYNVVFRDYSLFQHTAAFQQIGEIAFKEGGLADITLSILMAFREGTSDSHSKKSRPCCSVCFHSIANDVLRRFCGRSTFSVCPADWG